ncbi:MAG: hypothetical protein ACP5F6_00995 [Microbacter sp.]
MNPLNKKHIFFGLLALLMTVPMFQSCVQNDISLNNLDKTIGTNASLIFPIAKSTVTLQQFLDYVQSTNITSDASGNLIIYYQPNDPYLVDLNIPINDVKISQNVNFHGFTGQADINTVNAALTEVEDVYFDLHELSTNNINQLDSILVKQATFKISFANNINFNNNQLKLTVIPDPASFENIQPANIVQQYNGNSLNNQTLSFTFSHFTARPDQNGMVHFKVLLQELSPASDITLTSNSYFNDDLAISNIDFTAMYGQFSLQVPTQTQQIDMSFINQYILPSSTLPFSNPQIRLNMRTNARIPLDFEVDSLISYNNQQPGNTLSAIFKNGSHSCVFPLYNIPEKIGSWAQNNILFDKNNGQLDKLFTLPGINTLSLTFRGYTRTDTIVAQQFVLKNDTFIITPYITIPLAFNPGSNIMFHNTVNIPSSLTDFLQKSNAKQTEILLSATNYTSAQINLMVTLVGSANNPIGNPYQVNLKETIPLNSDGTISETSKTQEQLFSVPFSYNDLKTAQYIQFTYVIKGADLQSHLTLNKFNFVDVKIGAYAKGISYTH